MTRILLVEDEESLATVLRDDLELEGYSVDVETDGNTGGRRGAQGQYDLIVLDVMLPGKDGLTVCRELRAAKVQTPIIMLTARHDEVDRILGLELGADDYVTKPFSRRELQSRVKAVLRRTAMVGSTPSSLHEFDDVTVDLGRCEVRTRTATRELTALEVRLLRVFLANLDQVITIDRLNEAGWGKDVFITDRVVYTHINNLRNKLEANPRAPRHLITVRGMGYRFDS